MTSAYEHGQTILAGIIPDRPDRLDHALRHLTPDHFIDPVHRNLWLFIERYSEVTGAILTATALSDLLERSGTDAGKSAHYREAYDLLRDRQVADDEYTWSIEQARELSADRATGVALTQAMEILTRGAYDSKGEFVRGHGEARDHVLSAFADIDRGMSMQDAPEGDMRLQGPDMLADYAEREAQHQSGGTHGIRFGIDRLDEKVGSVSPGELVLAAAFTSEGKSSLMVQMAWHAAIHQQRNVVILTTETTHLQVRRRLLARHSCLDAFGLPDGLNSRHLKDGTLPAEQKPVLAKVVADFTGNPAYGRCYIVQVPRAATLSYVESKLARIHRQFPVHLAVMDYLALLKPDRRRPTDREELALILKEAKQLATTFDDGRGLPFISPWQVSRSARAEADKLGYYTSSMITADTAEASNSADLIVSLLAPLDNTDPSVTVKMQILKARDGEKSAPLDVVIDYPTSRFREVKSVPKSPGAAFTEYGYGIL